MQAKLTSKQFKRFKEQSTAWQRGEVSAQAYHAELVQLGLVSQVSALMSICPDAERRSELLAQHTHYVESGANFAYIRIAVGIVSLIWTPSNYSSRLSAEDIASTSASDQSHEVS